jgi:hypothetical protein
MMPMVFNLLRLTSFLQSVWRSRWAKEALALLVLVAIGGFFFWPILTGRTHLIGVGDTSDLILPYEIEIRNYLKQGIFPLWVSHNFNGFPTAGYPQIGIFYPIGLLFFWLGAVLNIDPIYIYESHFIFHVVLFSVGNYWFARSLKLSILPSLVAAVGSSYAPAILMFDVWGNAIPGFSWWGFALAALVLAQGSERRRFAYTATAGLALGQSILAAPSQPAIQLIFLIAGLFIAQAFSLWRERGRLPGLFGRYVVVAIIGLSIGALALVPVLEYANQSLRMLGKFRPTPTNEKMGFGAFTEYALHFKNVSGFLVHDLSMVAVGSNFIGAFLGLGVVLAITHWRKVGSPYFWYLVAMSAVSMFYAFNLGLPRLFYVIPGLNLIREPERYCQIFVFTVSFLAAFGLDGVLRNERAGILRRYVVTGLVFAFFALLMIGLASVRVAANALIPCEVESAVAIGWLVASLCDVPFLRPIMGPLFLLGTVWTMSAVPYLQLSYRDYDPHADIASMVRMSSLRPSGPEPFRVFTMRENALTARTYNANAAAVAGFYDIFGYHNPILMRTMRAYNMSYGGPTYLSLLNVRYIVTPPQNVENARHVVGKEAEIAVRFPDLLLRDGTWKLSRGEMVALENPNRYGAAWLVDSYDVVDRPWTNRDEIDGSKDPQSLMLRTEAADFDAGTKALVDRIPHLPSGEGLATSSDKPMPKLPVEWQSYGPNSFKMVVEAPRDALLVVSEPWYPGWRATVNGKETEIVRADWLLRAVAVPAGRAIVCFEYRPTSLVIGAIACLFGLAVTLIMQVPRLRPIGRP